MRTESWNPSSGSSCVPSYSVPCPFASCRHQRTSRALSTNHPSLSTTRPSSVCFSCASGTEDTMRETTRGMSDAIPTHGRSLRSTISSDGQLRLSLAEQEIPQLGDDQVLVAVEASPINPSDLGLLLGAVDPSTLRADGPALVGRVPDDARALSRDRMDQPLPVGNEGSGTVVAAGANAGGLAGSRVALFGGSMWADYRVADAGAI